MSVTLSDAFVFFLTVLYLSKTHFTSAIGMGRGEQVECNEKLIDKRQQLAVVWQPLVKLKTLLTSLKSWVKGHTTQKFTPKCCWIKNIYATTDLLLKIQTQLWKICQQLINTLAWSSTGKHSQALTRFKPLCTSTTITTPSCPQSGLDRNPSKPSLGSNTRGPASRCECVKW